MADALNNVQIDLSTEELSLHQALHGYSEGHRLLDSSIEIPDDLKRVMLRMSDLSGTSVVNGFQNYLTGYPLASLEAYAIAKTWYAPEMSRPGCVWTHTLIVPDPVLKRIANLAVLLPLFKRPSGRSIGDSYSKGVWLKSEVRKYEETSQHRAKLQEIIVVHYQADFHPIIVPAATSEEYEDLIFAVWSQKWPALRSKFTFCTGSLSGRSFENRPLDVQFVPVVASRQVYREVSETGLGEAIVLDTALPDDLPRWSDLAADDALESEGGAVRSFLWSVSESESGRADFESFMRVYDAIVTSLPFFDLLSLTAQLFPGSENGRRLKEFVFGDQSALSVSKIDVKERLIAFSTTKTFGSFDAEDLGLKARAVRLLAEQPSVAYSVLGDLFRADLNPIGNEILQAIISAMNVQDAQLFAANHQQFLPSLFSANPALASSAELWRVAKDRNGELFESLVALPDISPEVIRSIVRALLDSNSDSLIWRALQQWGGVAVESTLDWINAHDGSMSDSCRMALAPHFGDIAHWLARTSQPSSDMLGSLARIIAPHVRDVAHMNSTVWLRALCTMRTQNRQDDENYLYALGLALGLCNSPPQPLDLIAESFERVHRLAEKERLRDEAWLILQPLVPQLSWWKNWDKCERMRRALVSAFTRYSWPASELRERIKDRQLLKELLDSAREVGAEKYFRHI